MRFLLLGRAVPERMKDGRITICSAGVDLDTMELIRIYPTPINFPVRKWDIISLDLERNIQDTRYESWKIKDAKQNWQNIKSIVKLEGRLPDSDKKSLINGLVNKFGSCPDVLNEEKRSLGLVKPNILGVHFKLSNFDGTIQTDLYGNNFKIREEYEVIPYLKYQCIPECHSKETHDQQILEWGVYEFIRKNPKEYKKAIENLRILDDDWDKFLLIGNGYRYRCSFFIIDITRIKKQRM